MGRKRLYNIRGMFWNRNMHGAIPSSQKSFILAIVMIITYNWADENKEVNFYQQAHINKITLMFGSIDMVYNARNQTYRIVLFSYG